FTGSQATLEAIERELPAAEVFHFAGHGFSNASGGGLILASEQGRREPAVLDAARLHPGQLSQCGGNIEAAESVERIREEVGPDVFLWLCACAIYPELHWDLTLHLASLPCMPEGLVTEANLLRLIRLPWFRVGSVPEEIRSQFIEHLSSEQEREV